MYTDYFGLTAPLVSEGIASEDEIYRGEQQRDVETDLTLALGAGDAIAVVYGPAGTGKSTLAADTLRESVTRLAIGCLTDAAQTPHELLEQLLIEFGFSPYKMSRTERLNQWRQYLAEMATTGTRVGIVVENADCYRTDVLAELEALTGRDIRGNAGANLLLTARSPIPGLDTDSQLTALRQRCRAIVDVAALDAAETASYIRFQFERAGADWDQLAEPGLDARIHAAAGGAIRLIDNILESLMARAAHAGATSLSAELLGRVLSKLPGLHQSETRPSADAPGATAPAPEHPPESASPVDAAPVAGETDATADAQPAVQVTADVELEAPSAAPAAADPVAMPATPVPTPAPAPASAGQPDDAAPAEAGPAMPAAEAPAVPVPPPEIPTMTESVADIPVLEDIPVLDDAVAGAAQAPVTLTADADAELPLDGDLVEALLGLTSEPAAPDAQANAGPAPTETKEVDDGLSDEDRQQIEMLEAFANAEALEEISEAMAETIFGETLDGDLVAASLQGIVDTGIELEPDETGDAATDGPQEQAARAAGR